MAGAKWSEVLRFLRRLDAGQGVGATDAQLLQRFVQERDESAFELLLWRHGGMVLNVCRRVLRHDQDAEDAFQATFLALVRKAHSIRGGQAVASWLYQVAYRAALEARARSARIASHEKPAPEIEAPAPAEAGCSDLAPLLDEEVNRLPERLRRPFVLCYLEGKTNEEAARQLGCPTGTVFSRLAKGREILRTRLVRRGLVLSAGGFAVLLAENFVAASPAPALLTATLGAGLATAAGKTAALSPHVTALTDGVLKTMFFKKLKFAASLILALAFLAAGGSGFLFHALTAGPTDEPRVAPPAKVQAAGEKKAPDKADPNAPVVVQTVKPKTGGLEMIRSLNGALSSYEVVEIVPRVAGFLKKLNVDIGDRVKRDDVLAEIDAPDLLMDVKQAQIAVELAKAKIAQQLAMVANVETEFRGADTTIEARAADLEAARANLSYREAAFARMQDLFKAKSIEERIVDEAKANTLSARAKVSAAQVAIDAARGDKKVRATKVELAQVAVRIEDLQLESAKVGVARAALAVDATRLTAPFDGVVTTRNLNVGAAISAKDQKPVLKINRTDRMRLIVAVAGRDAVHVRAGMPVEVNIHAYPNKKLALKVSRFSASLSEKNGAMRVEMDVPNPSGNYIDGLSATATVNFGKIRPKALVVPFSSLTNNWTGVFVVRNGVAHLTTVETGESDQTARVTEIVTGLQPGDLVVLDPKGLKDGARVTVGNTGK